MKSKSTGTPSFAALRFPTVAKRTLVSHGRHPSSPSCPPPRLQPPKYPHGERRTGAAPLSTCALPPVQECTCGPRGPPPQAASSPWKHTISTTPRKPRSLSAVLAAVSRRAWDARCVVIRWGRGISRVGWLRVGCTPLGISIILRPYRPRGRAMRKGFRWVLKARGTGIRHPLLRSRRFKCILSFQVLLLRTLSTTSHQKALRKCHPLSACRNLRRYTLTDTSHLLHPRSSHRAPLSGTGSPVSQCGVKSPACSLQQVRAQRAFINKRPLPLSTSNKS